MNIFRKYGVWEYVLFLGGFLSFIKLVINYLNDTLENTVLNGIVLLVSVLMMAAPQFLVNKIKEKTTNLNKK